MTASNPQYLLIGFKQVAAFRIFTYQRQGTDPATVFTVRADLELARKHGIPMQDLPLLCRELLQQNPESPDAGMLTYSGPSMAKRAHDRTVQRELDALKRQSPKRRAATTAVGVIAH